PGPCSDRSSRVWLGLRLLRRAAWPGFAPAPAPGLLRAGAVGRNGALPTPARQQSGTSPGCRRHRPVRREPVEYSLTASSELRRGITKVIGLVKLAPGEL